MVLASAFDFDKYLSFGCKMKSLFGLLLWSDSQVGADESPVEPIVDF